MKKLLTLVVAIAMIFALAVPTFAHTEDDCDHQMEYEWYDDGCQWYEREWCVNCGYTEYYISGHHTVTESNCDGTFWFWRIWCPICGYTEAYESGSCIDGSCGNH